MDKIRKAYFMAWYHYWNRKYMRTKDETLVKGYNAMALAYKQKYRLIKYRPKGVKRYASK